MEDGRIPGKVVEDLAGHDTGHPVVIKIQRKCGPYAFRYDHGRPGGFDKLVRPPCLLHLEYIKYRTLHHSNRIQILQQRMNALHLSVKLDKLLEALRIFRGSGLFLI